MFIKAQRGIANTDPISAHGDPASDIEDGPLTRIWCYCQMAAVSANFNIEHLSMYNATSRHELRLETVTTRKNASLVTCQAP